jgi:hypothetical protein
MPDTTTPSPTRRRRGGHIAATIAGGIAGLVAMLMLAGGGALLWGDAQKDHDGYLSTGTDRFHTRTYAIRTDNLDVDTGGASSVLSHDLFGSVRLKATSHDGKRVFVGIARTSEVDAWLRGSAHATVTDVDTSPFHATYRTDGGGRPGAPGEQGFWAAKASGTGTQTLAWDVEDGNWSVVVMNADGSAGVDTGVVAGAELPWLDEAGWIVIGGGLLTLAVAGGLIAIGLRGPRERREPADVAPAAA